MVMTVTVMMMLIAMTMIADNDDDDDDDDGVEQDLLWLQKTEQTHNIECKIAKLCERDNSKSFILLISFCQISSIFIML